eukprot:6117393-Pyramimonas_sp.AAC.1
MPETEAIYVSGKACQHTVLTPETLALTVIGPEERNANGPLAVPNKSIHPLEHMLTILGY